MVVVVGWSLCVVLMCDVVCMLCELCCGVVVCKLCKLCCGGVVCKLCELCCGGVVCMLWCDVVTLLPHSCPQWAACCAGLRWEEVRLSWEHDCLTPAAVISRTPATEQCPVHPQPRHPGQLSLPSPAAGSSTCAGPESAAWVQHKSCLCLQSPIRWPGGHRAGVLWKQASWHVNYLIKLCQWFIGDPTFLCPTPNIRGSCSEWHVIVILLIFQYLQSILIACYWRCPATGLCPAVQNMFLMWHILLFSYNCLAACPQCPAILHLAAIVTLCRGY